MGLLTSFTVNTELSALYTDGTDVTVADASTHTNKINREKKNEAKGVAISIK